MLLSERQGSFARLDKITNLSTHLYIVTASNTCYIYKICNECFIAEKVFTRSEPKCVSILITAVLRGGKWKKETIDNSKCSFLNLLKVIGLILSLSTLTILYTVLKSSILPKNLRNVIKIAQQVRNQFSKFLFYMK